MSIAAIERGRYGSGHAGTARGLRTVAVFEATKGLVVLLAGGGLLELVHRDVQRVAEEVVGTLHMNPAHHYPRVFLHAAARLSGANLVLLAACAALYAAVRFVEAYGLWRLRAWAQWFGIVSGGVYLPVELYELARRATWVRGTLFALNVALVAYLVWVRLGQRRGAARPT